MAHQNSGNSAFISPPPRVSVVEGPSKVVALAYAAARTCYSEELVFPNVFPEDRSSGKAMVSLAQSTYQAGHHTLWQHPNFVFALQGVSRLLVWSLLHSFPYYNTSQQSQRYVRVNPEAVVIPPLGKDSPNPLERYSLELYQDVLALMMNGYQQLIDLLRPVVALEYRKIVPEKRKGFDSEVEKKAQEVARYVLPLATKTNLYYTVSLLTLMRLWRLCQGFDVSAEARLVVGMMIQAVKERDPLFGQILEEPLPVEEIHEAKLLSAQHLCLPEDIEQAVSEFDGALKGWPSRLVDWSAQSEATLAAAARNVLGLPFSRLTDEAAIALVLDPAQNPYLAQTLNLTAQAKLAKVMAHSHWTFRESLSNTCDAQAQRHRTTPSSRPVLWGFLSEEPDYVTPTLIRQDEKALRYYEDLMARVWKGIREFRNWGAPAEFAAYLLPNAVTIRGFTSTDLAALWHKAKMRLCYNAQEEIWHLLVAQVREVDRVAPNIGKWLLAPCQIRRLAGITPYCPEGSRYCGVPVWEVTDHDYPPRII